MIEIRHLKLIQAIAHHGSMNQAAKALHLSPSALSHQLKQLEAYLEMPIFHRSSNQLLFTSAGKEFKESAELLLGQIDDLEDRISTIKRSNLKKYIHGYSQQETTRLYDQAHTIEDFLHWDSHWEAGSYILEAGCGVGAQTSIIANKNPDCRFLSVDIAPKSIKKAKQTLAPTLPNVQFAIADLTSLTYPANSFDHIFVCFVLEHLSHPKQILLELKRVLKKGGSITVIEGDHGSTYFHPDNSAARKAVQAQVILQQQNGGNANIGRTLHPLLQAAGFQQVTVSPRQIYADDSKPILLDGFVNKTFTAMIEGVQEEVVANGILTSAEMEKGIQALLQTAKGNGTFCYTFFKAKGIKGT